MCRAPAPLASGPRQPEHAGLCGLRNAARCPAFAHDAPPKRADEHHAAPQVDPWDATARAQYMAPPAGTRRRERHFRCSSVMAARPTRPTSAARVGHRGIDMSTGRPPRQSRRPGVHLAAVRDDRPATASAFSAPRPSISSTVSVPACSGHVRDGRCPPRSAVGDRHGPPDPDVIPPVTSALRPVRSNLHLASCSRLLAAVKPESQTGREAAAPPCRGTVEPEDLTGTPRSTSQSDRASFDLLWANDPRSSTT